MNLVHYYRSDYGDFRLPEGAVVVLSETPLRVDGRPDRRYRLGRAFLRYERELDAWAAERFRRGEPLVDPPAPKYRITSDAWRDKIRQSILAAFHRS